MVQLIALQAGRHQGRHVEPGDVFDAPADIAITLVLARRARFATPQSIDALRHLAERERWFDPMVR